MIVFKNIKYKNFLSTGNTFNEVKLDEHKATLITGRNGEGKSTILCALTFVLFGKPFRNISKGQLVNSINGKNCVVEIEFSVNGHNYLVRRGIKPNVFDIMCDGELINQDAATKDYQKVLEQQILKLNYKTFTQVVILGSATFVPFMQLPAAQRREVIEDILDIRVFSLMNVILKSKLGVVNERLNLINNQIANHKTKIAAQKKLIEVLESNKQQVIQSLQQKIDANSLEITSTQQLAKDLVEQMNDMRADADTTEQTEALNKARKIEMKVSSQMDTCNHHIQFFEDNTVCPTCSQEIHEDHKLKMIDDLNEKIVCHQDKLSVLSKALSKLESQLDHAKAVADQIRTKSIEHSTLINKIQYLTNQNNDLQQELHGVVADSADLAKEKQKMKELAEEAITLVNEKSEMLDQKQLHDVAALLLKDTGIKTAIVREYLPVINKLINKYLAAMDFFVKFELDESFQEEIKSRGRDDFTYSSFSEGEKRRLDLAILFTWRQIAKMKNSVNTNLMILDEILDGALDGAGIDYFLNIMEQFGDNTNVFVISHKVDQMIDRFEHVIRFEKKNDFSVIAS